MRDPGNGNKNQLVQPYPSGFFLSNNPSGSLWQYLNPIDFSHYFLNPSKLHIKKYNATYSVSSRLYTIFHTYDILHSDKTTASRSIKHQPKFNKHSKQKHIITLIQRYASRLLAIIWNLLKETPKIKHIPNKDSPFLVGFWESKLIIIHKPQILVFMVW